VKTAVTIPLLCHVLDQLITGHEHLDGRITEVREDVRDMRTDLRAVNQRLDNHIHGD
jgi:hypothetical protein